MSTSSSFSPVKDRGQLSFTMPISQLYSNLNANASEYGVPGYKVPKKSQLITYRDYSFSKAKRSGIFGTAEKRASEPGPYQYSPSHEETAKRNWGASPGRFLKSPRLTVIGEIMKTAKGTPGPGFYPSSDQHRIPSWKYARSELPSYLGTVESLAEEVPGVGHYWTKPGEREKAMSFIQHKSPSPKIKDPIPPKIKEKEAVGPGYLTELEKKMNYTKEKAPNFSFRKARHAQSLSVGNRASLNIPPVGYYNNIDNAYTKTIVIKKERMPMISKSKFERYSEETARLKKWVPGPGSYDILPKTRVKAK